MQRLTSLLWIIVLLCHYHLVWGIGIQDNLRHYETLSINDIRSRVRRSVDANPAFDLKELWFKTMGRDFHLTLKQSSILTADFKATAVKGNNKEEFYIDRSKFLTGKIKNEDDSMVSVHWDGEIMTASISTKDEVYYVEPSWRHLPPSVNHSMVAYKKSDLIFDPDAKIGGRTVGSGHTGDTVGMELNDGIRLFPREPDPEIQVTGEKKGPHRDKREVVSPILGPRTVCRLAVVADHYFFTNMGRSDRFQSGEYMISLMDRVNGIFKNTVWTDNREEIIHAGFEIGEMIIHESYTDVGDSNHYNMKDRPRDMSLVLDWFGESHVQDFSKVCLGHLFTYQAFRGKLGLAYIASPYAQNLGGICSDNAYVAGHQQAVNTGVSSFQTPGGSTSMSQASTLTVSHELSHNWGSEHDPDTSSCSPSTSSGGKFIMYPRSTTGFQANNQIFSLCSRQYIFKVLQAKGYDCFSEPTSGIGLCGNGRIDKGEECDSGYNGDNCCDRQCKLIGRATCSHLNFPCCDKISCQKATAFKKCRSKFGCKEDSYCAMDETMTCPPAANVIDGENCGNFGEKCYNGLCLGLCQQQGKIPCICEDAASLCQMCCQGSNGTGACSSLPGRPLPEGSPCIYGFCENGKCEKSGTIVKRLYKILQYFSINQLGVVMKDNVVWVILTLSTIMWLIIIAIFEYNDWKEEKTNKPTFENMRKHEKVTLLPGRRNDVSAKIHAPIIRRQQFD